MIAADRRAFAQAFNRLAVATRLPAAEADAAMQQVYWGALEDLPAEAVTGAADALAKTAQWFPKVAEWRRAAYQQQLTDVLRLPAGRDEDWHHECARCEDTGWVTKSCTPGTPATCGRPVQGAHQQAHAYTVRCACRDSNRTYARHHRVPRGREPGGFDARRAASHDDGWD